MGKNKATKAYHIKRAYASAVSASLSTHTTIAIRRASAGREGKVRLGLFEAGGTQFTAHYLRGRAEFDKGTLTLRGFPRRKVCQPIIQEVPTNEHGIMRFHWGEDFTLCIIVLDHLPDDRPTKDLCWILHGRGRDR